MSESRYALTALMHVVLARNSIVHYDIDSSLMLAEDPVVGGIEYKGSGKWELDDKPGIGAAFDENYLNEMERVIV